jgi:hypothetical protein
VRHAAARRLTATLLGLGTTLPQLAAASAAVSLLASGSCHVYACSGSGCKVGDGDEDDDDGDQDDGQRGPDAGAAAGEREAHALLALHLERLGWRPDGGAFEVEGRGADAGGRWVLFRRVPGASGRGGRALARLDRRGRVERLVAAPVAAGR